MTDREIAWGIFSHYWQFFLLGLIALGCVLELWRTRHQ
jgi:hypothetical protein